VGVESSRRWDTAIVWFRRDLRIHDHPALVDAVANAGRVVPLFVLDDALLDGRRPCANRVSFMLESVEGLGQALEQRGASLTILRGRPDSAVPAFAAEVGAEAVLASRDDSPYGRRRDEAVAAALSRDGRTFHARRGNLLHEPEDVRTRDGGSYSVFSPYWRAAGALPLRSVLATPASIPGISGARQAAERTALPPAVALSSERVAAGESAARKRLRAFIETGVRDYADDRNRLDRDGTSRLSQDLRFGLLSPVEVASAVEDAARAEPVLRSGADAFIRQLGWRDFYHHLLYERPELLSVPFQARYEGVAYRDPESDPEAAADLRAWERGETGYPIVDAAMRQLHAIGWMHNRGRLIVASFLTRQLLIAHRHGERHFMDWLTDGDVANNNGGWQWTAGVGTDAQPWFRVLNPLLQAKRFDPDGDYVRRWLPELAGLKEASIHEPWTSDESTLRGAGIRLGDNYPERIVDLAFGRQRALDAFKNR
jgi:deoxyribodipyrimidine photo-lyase